MDPGTELAHTLTPAATRATADWTEMPGSRDSPGQRGRQVPQASLDLFEQMRLHS